MDQISIRKTNAVKKFIKKSWVDLSRTYETIVHAVLDEKIKIKPNATFPIYISKKEDLKQIKSLYQNKVKAEDYAQISIRRLPKDYYRMNRHGLLHLPYPYVVPGGHFNEMYGWDSHFIILGLLNDGYFQLAIWMVENLIYQIEHYGKILNGNRSYYLTRSQPPLLGESVIAIYEKTKDKKWLASTLPALEKFYQLWNKKPRYVKSVGLSRYCAESRRRPPEVSVGYYRNIKKYYRTRWVKSYNVAKFYNKQTNTLTPEFFLSDRTVRESGCDLSNKYGPFGADIIHYIPVALNALLCRMEDTIARIYHILKNKSAQKDWLARKKHRAALIDYYLWDPDLGYYFDYNFKSKRSRPYINATTFFPLWAKIANGQQAKRIVDNLAVLECEGGIIASAYVTGMQWDAPFGWAPHQLFAIEGLYHYGYDAEAKRITKKYINMINNDFARTNNLYEKYNLRTCSSDVEGEITWGYRENHEGFGWTNGVYLELLKHLIEN